MTALRDRYSPVDIRLARGPLCAPDIGAVVQLYPTDAVGVALVTASCRTQALLTLRFGDARAVPNDDFIHR